MLKMLQDLTVLKIKKNQLLLVIHLIMVAVKMELPTEMKTDLIVQLKKKPLLMKMEMKSLMIIFV